MTTRHAEHKTSLYMEFRSTRSDGQLLFIEQEASRGKVMMILIGWLWKGEPPQNKDESFEDVPKGWNQYLPHSSVPAEKGKKACHLKIPSISCLLVGCCREPETTSNYLIYRLHHHHLKGWCWRKGFPLLVGASGTKLKIVFFFLKKSQLPSKTIKLLYFLKVKKNLFMLKHYIIYMSLPSKKKIRSTILLTKIKHKKDMNFLTILLKKIETPKGMQSTKSFVTFSI